MLVVLDLEVSLNFNQVAISVSLGPVLHNVLADALLLMRNVAEVVGTENGELGFGRFIQFFGFDDRSVESHRAAISINLAHNN